MELICKWSVKGLYNALFLFKNYAGKKNIWRGFLFLLLKTKCIGLQGAPILYF